MTTNMVKVLKISKVGGEKVRKKLIEMDVLDELPDIKPEDYEEKEKVTTKAMNEFLEGEVNWHVLKETEED